MALQNSDLFVVGRGASTYKVPYSDVVAGVTLPSAATETAAGIVELATAAETTTGTDNTRAVHPAGLKVELDKKATDAPDGTADGTKQYLRQVVTAGTNQTKSWVAYTAPTIPAPVTTGDKAPTSPSAGDLWYDTVGGRTYVYYTDATSSQWVDCSPQGGGSASDWSRTGTTLSPAVAGDDVDLGTGDISGAAATFTGALSAAAGTFSGDVKVGGTLPASPNISLKADGSGTFSGNVQAADLSIRFPGAAVDSVNVYSSAGGGVIYIRDGAGAIAGEWESIGLNVGGTGLGLPTARPNIVLSTTGIIYAVNTTITPITSERRLKENITPIDADIAWQTVRDVPYYSYNFIGSDPSRIVYGPMADEVPAEMRVDTGRTDDVGAIHTYNNGMLQARLYVALQTALTRIETLEAEVASLKAANGGTN